MLPLSENALDEIVAREREHGTLSLTDWDSLSARLRSEGLIRDPIVSRLVSKRWMQAAAGLALAVGGAAAGRASVGAPVIPLTQTPAVASEPVEAAPASQSFRAPQSASEATLASSGGTQFSTPEEAWEVLNRAGEEYQRASSYLSANNAEVPMPTDPSQYRTRLAALDNVMVEIRGALKAAPQDPVINQYYLATVGAREATLRQLGTTLRPEGVSLSRF